MQVFIALVLATNALILWRERQLLAKGLPNAMQLVNALIIAAVS